MSVLRVYHRTQRAAEILRDGFRDGYKAAVDAETSDLIELRGVWVSAEWPLDDNEGAHGDDVIELTIPDELFAKYEWVEEGNTYRESMIPATELNLHLSTARILSDAEVDALTVRRWESFR